MTVTTNDRSLCGWRVSSDWPLPELMPWLGDSRAADIRIRRGTVPKELPGLVHKHPLVQVNHQNWLRYTIRNVADYLVCNGNEVIIDTPHPDDMPDVALFLLGSVLGFLCHQRGLLPLHASCVVYENQVIAFTGQSGAGKSTIAALLLAQGARLLADDVTVIDTYAADGPMILPSYPRQKLWRDTLDALGIVPGRYLRRMVQLEKFDRPVAGFFDTAPMRLDTICHLRPRMRQGGLELIALNDLQSIKTLYENVYRRTAAGLLGLSETLFRNCATLAKTLPHKALILPDGIDLVAQMGPQLGRVLAASR